MRDDAGGPENAKQAPVFRADPDAELEPTKHDIVTQVGIKSQTLNLLRPPRRPGKVFLVRL